MHELLKTCEQAARAAAEVLLGMQGHVRVRQKGPRDLVTEADLASQRAIHKIISGRFPSHAFLGEEDPTDPAQTLAAAEYCWVVDPLDGTTNYVHGLPQFAVSIAVARAGQPEHGVILVPASGECFTATRGAGAFLNDAPIRTSDVGQLSEALVSASFAAQVDEQSKEIRQFLAVLPRCQAIRRFGSAAMNLAYLAAGRFDAYWAANTKPWDVAAGVLLVHEAGGVVSDLGGGPFQLARGQFAAAASAQLHGELLRCFAAG